MNLGACVGLKHTTTGHRSSIASGNRHGRDRNPPTCFFDGENYQSILERLDSGYEVSKDLIKFMEDDIKPLRSYGRNLASRSQRAKARLIHQSNLSSYTSTREMLIQTVHASEQYSENIAEVCAVLQKIIKKSKEQMNQIYKPNYLRRCHEHCQTKKMKNAFVAAYTRLRTSEEKRDSLNDQEKEARDALDDANAQCDALKLDPVKNKKNEKLANDFRRRKQDELAIVEGQVALAVAEYEDAKEIYRERTTQLFLECQELEKTRLDQLKQVIIDFSEAICSSDYSTAPNAIYEKLLLKLKTEYNPSHDLATYARAYGINTLPQWVYREGSSDNSTTLQ